MKGGERGAGRRCRGPRGGFAGVVAAMVLVTGCSSGVSLSPGPPPEPPPPVTTVPGVPESVGPAPPALVSYTAIQARQGREAFEATCSACHALGEFRGQMFRMTWMARPIGHFYQLIATTMPQDAPGSLEPADYAAVVAYILQLNGHPAGSVELPPGFDALAGLAWPR
jgi:mono/diheme cytochrome c family protein